MMTMFLPPVVPDDGRLSYPNPMDADDVAADAPGARFTIGGLA